MTGELVDLSTTYGPALTDGFTRPTPEIIFPNLTQSSTSDENDSEEESFNQTNQSTLASSTVDSNLFTL